MKAPAILYCHCQYARVLPDDVKDAVLRKLCESAQPFEAVADLCELSARKDPALARLAAAGPLKIAACFPRALKWLFASANAPLSIESTEVVNLRTLSTEEACSALFTIEVTPNLAAAKATPVTTPAPLNQVTEESLGV
jgi:hypothetical protein